jgi:hypothetical protein
LTAGPAGMQTTLPITGLSSPYGVAVDVSGNVYVADSSNNQVVELTAGPTGTQTTLPITGLSYPIGVAVDANGTVYVTDTFDSTNNYRVMALAAGASSATTLPLTGLQYTWGVAVDAHSDVYVGDVGNHRVVELPNADATQAITGFTPTTPGTYGGTQTLTATGGPGSAPVVFSVDTTSDAGVCTTTGTNGATLTYTGTGSCVIDANQAATRGYGAAASQRSVAIAKATLTATVSNASRRYGAANPAFKLGAFTGYVHGDTRTVVTGTAHLSSTATRSSRVGTYPITATRGTLTAHNYTFVLRRGTLTVTKAGVKLKAPVMTDDGFEGSYPVTFTATVTSAVTSARIAGIKVTFTARTAPARP